MKFIHAIMVILLQLLLIVVTKKNTYDILLPDVIEKVKNNSKLTEIDYTVLTTFSNVYNEACMQSALLTYEN